MKGGKFSKLKWVTPKGKPKPLTMGMKILAASPAGKAIRTLFADVGIPTPKEIKQPERHMPKRSSCCKRRPRWSMRCWCSICMPPIR